MEEPKVNVEEDLEDGEIESDGDEATGVNQTEENTQEQPTEETENPQQGTPENKDFSSSKSGKKKKSKSHKSEQKKDKNKKRKRNSLDDDDYAGNIEKAIRKAMNKKDHEDSQYDDDDDSRRKHKKRKKYDRDGSGKKRKKQEYSDELDENEMMCVRGASPVHKSPTDQYDDERESYTSDSSHESREHHRSRRRNRSQPRERNKNKNNDRRRNAHPNQDPDGVCLYYMQGKCHKGDDCIYSHDAQPPRKMELCKFYLMDCCAKRDKCLYMHADFPCKYYHTGLPCIYKDECKFAHGKPLNESLKNILLKHIESAPKEILGDFPRLNREGALKMIQTTQAKLIQQYPEFLENLDKNIPSLFELNIPNPQFNNTDNNQSVQYSNDRQNKISPKIRHSRWQNDSQNSTMNLSPSNNSSNSNVLSIKNLNGVLTPRQISDLTKMGIENLDQLGQLTVLQLNSIGISLKQITDIQLNTMSIQKLGLINTNVESKPFVSSTNISKDLDLRVPPVAPVANTINVSTDLPGKDIDMRFQPPALISNVEEITAQGSSLSEIKSNKDMIDIDQYTKDALKFATKDKENIDVSNDNFESEIKNEIKDVDHRVLPFSEEAPKILQQPCEGTNTVLKKELDTDIRFLQPDPIFKSPEKRHRRSTTDDEDNLCIDEKWYSSDEEKCNKKKSPVSSPLPQTLSPQNPTPPVIEPSTVLSRLGDLSKIDISEEVTKLLNTMKNNLHENKTEVSVEPTETSKLRDPRSRRSPDKLSDKAGEKLVNTNKTKKIQRVSIYECIDGEPTDGRRRTDVDLRNIDVPNFGDTDLRQRPIGDIDLRLGLPFKPLPNYTPASEINGSINSHPPIQYKLVTIDIPRPDYSDIRDSTAKSQALVDPRLRKVFRLSIEESNSDNEKSIKATTPAAPRVDPRRKPKELSESQDQKQNSLDLQTVLQNSNWYKDLSSTQKIFVNQNLAPVTQMIKQYQQEKNPGKKFDLMSIQSNPTLCSIFANLGISLNDSSEFSYLPKPKEALLKTPVFNKNSNMFGNMQMEPGNRNMMNMTMGMPGPGMNSMPGFNQHMGDPRGGPAPGLLGMAPNMPHNFGGPANYGNMPFNGPGGEFNFMDGEPNFSRFPNRGAHRGRGNDRWNRGGSGRGNRDRKNFNDRGNWKNDRL